jgi:hypothetical protein
MKRMRTYVRSFVTGTFGAVFAGEETLTCLVKESPLTRPFDQGSILLV